MDVNNLLRFWVAAFACSTLTAAILGLAWFRNRQRVRRLEDHLLGQHAVASPEPRHDQLAQRVDALAACVERLEDGQEFLSRLVAGQRPPLPPGSDRIQPVTPH